MPREEREDVSMPGASVAELQTQVDRVEERGTLAVWSGLATRLSQLPM